MRYSDLRLRLVGLFDQGKLNARPGEWGFFHELKRDVQIVGYATNLTPETIQEAKRLQVDFMLTHHDSWGFVFGLRERCNAMLREYDMAHAFFHAPLDDADFGTSASLAGALGMKDCKRVMPYADVFFAGRAGSLETELTFGQFASRLAVLLKEPVRQFQNNEKPVKRVCVAAGGGNMTTEMKIAVENGCDTYVTGEYGLYSQQYARLAGMNLFVGSHTNTEILGVQAMAEKAASGADLELRRIPESND